jgi:hypothetical protein
MTNTSNRGGYRQTLLNRGLLSDEMTTKPQEIKRENRQKHYIREEPAAAGQRVSNS